MGYGISTAAQYAVRTLVVLAAAFNAAVDHFRLLRLAPRRLSQLMLTLTISILVVPQALAHARAVAEAKRLRGRRASGLRALPGLLLPVLQYLYLTLNLYRLILPLMLLPKLLNRFLSYSFN